MSDEIPASTPAAGGTVPGKGLADHKTKLALTRTLLAADRTLMAWVRTAMSLISFGFTIYKFFQYLEGNHAAAVEGSLLTPRDVALVMIGLGVVSLFIATIEYRNQVRMMRRSYSEYGPFHRSLAAIVAALISVLGMLGFGIVLLRQ